MKLIPLISGDEQDALSRRYKRPLKWRPGQRKAAKRSFWKRVRATFKLKDRQTDDPDPDVQAEPLSVTDIRD